MKAVSVDRRAPSNEELLGAMLAIAASAFSEKTTIYRSCSPRFATSEGLLSGEGSLRHGGRWNPPGTRAIYGSDCPETALAESLREVRRCGFSDADALPRTFVAVDVTLARVVDVTSESVLSRLRIELPELTQVEWREGQKEDHLVLPQRLGVSAKQASLEAIWVPSAARLSARNLVIFPENLQATSRLRILNGEKLG